ncbi:hypothetical protein L596_030658 [Steinernema carpocapsae]|uniref:Uncharacterized protein n=1 Tax=Steinernema carpocapsae TaxID=34508 RepID=A0A4U5LQ23_STECR|nr:hypothetical protein L596_030658 [Steinernema carpocapsae]
MILHGMLSVNLLSGSSLTIKKLSILLHHLKYSRRKIDNPAVLYDNHSVIRSRERYLSQIREARTEGYRIFYLNETWVHKGMSHMYDWQSHYTPEEKKGYCSGPTTPAEHGKRAIVVHTVGKDGLVEGALKTMIGQRSHGEGDYHKEMTSSCATGSASYTKPIAVTR